jgi:hypothetical protein
LYKEHQCCRVIIIEYLLCPNISSYIIYFPYGFCKFEINFPLPSKLCDNPCDFSVHSLVCLEYFSARIIWKHAVSVLLMHIHTQNAHTTVQHKIEIPHDILYHTIRIAAIAYRMYKITGLQILPQLSAIRAHVVFITFMHIRGLRDLHNSRLYSKCTISEKRQSKVENAPRSL